MNTSEIRKNLRDSRLASSIARHLIESGHKVEPNKAFNLLCKRSGDRLPRSWRFRKFAFTLCIQNNLCSSYNYLGESILKFELTIFTRCELIFDIRCLYVTRVRKVYSMDASCKCFLLIVLLMSSQALSRFRINDLNFFSLSVQIEFNSLFGFIIQQKSHYSQLFPIIDFK